MLVPQLPALHLHRRRQTGLSHYKKPSDPHDAIRQWGETHRSASFGVLE
jgi:hypothetical protein